MHLILLAGNSIDNKNWIKKVELLFRPHFTSTQIQYYKHWELGGKLINMEMESKRLTQLIKSKEQFAIFAKSAGILVVLKSIQENKIAPIKCFFVGVPVSWAKKYKYTIDKWFKNFKIPSIIIQHTNDPITSAKDLSGFLLKSKAINYKLINLPGNDHHYQELDKIKKLILKSI